MIKHTGYYIELWDAAKQTYERIAWYRDYGVAEQNRKNYPGHSRLQPTY